VFAHQNNEPEPETIRTFPVHIFDKLTAGETNWSPKNPLGTKLYCLDKARQFGYRSFNAALMPAEAHKF
jgi:hypothetical protein